MEKINLNKELQEAKNIPEIFELVKKTVKHATNLEQAGLTLSLSNLGTDPNMLLGAFYSPEANMIVMNNSVLKNIRQKNPRIYNSYIFHILLHEYLHSTGLYDENQTRQVSYLISQKYLGNEHDVTKMAQNWNTYLKDFVDIRTVQDDNAFEFVQGFNKSDLNYIG